MRTASLFSCPECGSHLTLQEAAATCSECATVTPLIGNAADLMPSDPIDSSQDRAIETDFEPHRKRKGPISEYLGRQHWRTIGSTLHDLTRSLDRGLDVLDVGCGTKLDPRRGSWYPTLLSPVARTYRGVDPSPLCAAVSSQAKRNLSEFEAAEIARAAAEQLPLPDANVDVVLILSVLDHCADPAQALRECHRVLRPGGLLLVWSGLRHNWVHEVSRRLMPRTIRRRDEHDHHVHFTIGELGRLVNTAGFDDYDIQEWGYVTLPPQGRRVERVVAGLGSLAGHHRFLRAMNRVDSWSSERFPGYGSRVMLTASRR
jgi:SAM-dependent methyltransferase